MTDLEYFIASSFLLLLACAIVAFIAGHTGKPDLLP